MIDISKVERRLSAYKLELSQAIDGYLEFKNNRYYHTVRGIRKGIKRNPIVFDQLCRKALVELCTENSEAYLRKPHDFKRLKTPYELISLLPEAYKDLALPHFYHPNSPLWLKEKVSYNSLFPEQKLYETKCGIKTRSKDERDIANLLNEAGLLYRYEPVYDFHGERLAPDFHIYDPLADSQCLWEHYGLLKNNDYLKSMSHKMDIYLRYGYQENVDLILSFDYHLWQPKRIRHLIDRVIFNVVPR